MILLLDVGNTRVKWAWLDYLEVAPAGAIAHDATHRSWQSEIEADGHRPERVVASNVAGPAFAAALRQWASSHFGLEPEFVMPAAAGFGVRNGYQTPAALGADRWLGLVAARRSSPTAACIVSSGSAFTVDALDGGGRHLGGFIVPGLQMMLDAQAGLGPATRWPAGTAFGKSVPDCAALMLSGLANRALALLAAATGGPARCILTGGDAPLVAADIAQPVEIVPDLVLTGLAICATARAP